MNVAAMIYGNANGWSKLLWDTSSLQLFKRKSFTSSEFHVVFGSLSMNNWPKRSSSRPGENLNCLLLASQASSGLPCWLIKLCLHVVLPMFTKMFIGDNIVVLNHGALPARLLLTCSLVVVLQVEFEDYSRLNMRFCRMLSREQGFYCNYFSCQVMQKFSK